MVRERLVAACRASVVIALVAACVPTTRSQPTSAGHSEIDASAEGVETALEDEDGEVEAESEAVRTNETSPCPTNMVLVEGDDVRVCVDRYEASLVEVDGEGNEKPFPHWLPVDGHVVRAVSEPDVFPQGFISEVQAEDACGASAKRLCSYKEWKTACMGPTKTTFPYGDTRQPGTCHDTGKSAVGSVFGARAMTDPGLNAHPTKPAAPPASKPGTTVAKASPNRPALSSTKGRAAETTRARKTRPGTKASKRADAGASGNKAVASKSSMPRRSSAVAKGKRIPAKSSQRPASVEPSVWTQLNDPRLGQVEGALAKTGSHEACTSGYGALDMMGNLHEWVKTDPTLPHGTFAGGYYLDTSLNGDGCQYRTTAHAHDYHDYSTGFRCCAEPLAP